MSLTSLANELSQRLQAVGIDNAKRVAEELIAHVLDCKLLEIYLRSEPLTTDNLQSVEVLTERILNGEPLQYVTGHVDFRGLEIKCDPRALIPRPETELLVEEVLNSGIWQKAGIDRSATELTEVRASRPVPKQPDGRLGDPSLPPTNPRIVDVGTGTGCIVLALAQQQPEADFVAIDSSPAALGLARENARLHGLENKIKWKENHLLDGFTPESCDAVVANLPYIASNDWKALSPAVRDHEPQSALDSGPSGMELIEELAVQARAVLVPGGMLFLEFGYDQGNAVSQCLEKSGYCGIRIRQDLAGLDRIAIAKNP
jgi:release factor glutamine methyltransferase